MTSSLTVEVVVAGNVPIYEICKEMAAMAAKLGVNVSCEIDGRWLACRCDQGALDFAEYVYRVLGLRFDEAEFREDKGKTKP